MLVKGSRASSDSIVPSDLLAGGDNFKFNCFVWRADCEFEFTD